MPTFISLVNFTGQGIKDIRNTTQRLTAFGQAAESMGVTVKAAYYTAGRYDMVVITEAPDSETASALALGIGSLGNVRTETLMAFSPGEMDGILAKLP